MSGADQHLAKVRADAPWKQWTVEQWLVERQANVDAIAREVAAGRPTATLERNVTFIDYQIARKQVAS